MLDDILAAVPSLKGQSRVGLLIWLCALYKSEPLEATQEGNCVKGELPQPPVTLLKKQIAGKERKKKERKVRRVTEAKSDLMIREP